jgi:hypothetical protein
MLNQKFNVVDPDPKDPYVFGPHESGSLCLRYGSGSGFYHQAKLVRKAAFHFNADPDPAPH